jgi:hypothetical protein
LPRSEAGKLLEFPQSSQTTSIVESAAVAGAARARSI